MKWVYLILDFLAEWFHGALRANKSSLAVFLRRNIVQTRCFLDTQVIITNPRNFKAGEQTALYHGTYILNHHGRFSLGSHSHLSAYCYVNVCYGSVIIGNDVAIGPGVKIISYSNHYSKGKKVSEERITAEISIGNNVFIGSNCTILPGTIIEDHVIIGAGAVVKGRLEQNSIYGGVPCKLLKKGWYE